MTIWRKRWAAWKGALALTFGVVTVALTITVVVQAIEIMLPHTKVLWGSISEALAAIGTLLAVGVALWQSSVIRRQAEHDASDTARRFAAEIEAANNRTIQEVEAAEQRSQRELEAAAKRHEAELASQREVARVQRVHQREQEFKVAVTRVARAVSSYTHELATLISRTRAIVALPTREERDDAVAPIAKSLNLATHVITIEIAGARMLTNNEQLQTALDPILHAGVVSVANADEYENILIIGGQTPNEAPIYSVMEALNAAVGNVTKLAGQLLLTGWD